MTDQQGEIRAAPVSRAEVRKALGHPSEWPRLKRRRAPKKRSRPDTNDFGIADIRGYGSITGYLHELENMLASAYCPDTDLVSDGGNERIRQTVKEETAAEIAKYSVRLSELERSPEAVEECIGHIRVWLTYRKQQTLADPEAESDDEMRTLVLKSNEDLVAEIATLSQELLIYEALLQRLKKQ